MPKAILRANPIKKNQQGRRYLSCGELYLHIFHLSSVVTELWSPLALTDTAGRGTCGALSLQAAAVPRKLWKKKPEQGDEHCFSEELKLTR